MADKKKDRAGMGRVYAGPEPAAKADETEETNENEGYPETFNDNFTNEDLIKHPEKFLMVYAGPEYFMRQAGIDPKLGSINYQAEDPKPEPPKEEGGDPVLPEGSWFCKVCGALNDGRFCKECGSPKPKE